MVVESQFAMAMDVWQTDSLPVADGKLTHSGLWLLDCGGKLTQTGWWLLAGGGKLTHPYEPW